MKKKKIIKLIILFIISLQFVGCTFKTSEPKVSITSKPEASFCFEEISIIPISEITLSSYLQGPETEHFTIVEKNEDSVTYQLVGNQQAETLNQIAAQIKESITQILQDKEFYPKLKKVTVNEDCSEFNVTFEGTELNVYETTLQMSLYIAGDRFQLYQGQTESKPLTVVNYIEESTGEIFSTGDSNGLQ